MVRRSSSSAVEQRVILSAGLTFSAVSASEQDGKRSVFSFGSPIFSHFNLFFSFPIILFQFNCFKHQCGKLMIAALAMSCPAYLTLPHTPTTTCCCLRFYLEV